MSRLIFGSSLVAFVALVGAALAGEGPDPSAIASSCHGQKTQAAAGCHGDKAAEGCHGKARRTTMVQRVAARQESRQEARASRQAARAAASSCHGQQQASSCHGQPQAAPVEVCECDCSDCNCE